MKLVGHHRLLFGAPVAAAAALLLGWSPQPEPEAARSQTHEISTPDPMTAEWVETDPSQGASCGSVASIALPIFIETAERARARNCTLTKTATGGLAANACTASASAALVSDMLNFWNRMAGNSWATIGPRDWTIYPSPESHSGTILAKGTRLFVSPHPMFLTDKVRVSVRKVEGLNATNVTFCASNAAGAVQKKWELRLTGSTPDNELYTKEFSGLRGLVPSINFQGTQLTRKMGYRVRGTGLN